ncbi:Bacterial mobilisation domain-containing protein, partial [Dysosmobacter welbionis]
LLVGDHSAKHSVLPHGRGDVLIRLELPGVHPLLCVPDACLGRHSGDGHRVVAGDDLHIHALGVEVIEDFGSVGADGILQHQQGQGDHHAVEAPDLRPVALGQQQYPAALG